MRQISEAGALGGRTEGTAGAGRNDQADGGDRADRSDGGAFELRAGGQRLRLLPEKAAYLPDAATLFVADAHIGKATSFRQLGVPVPAGTTDETLAALTRLVDRLALRRIVFLGDFLHSKRSLAPCTMASVARWRERHAALELTLVRGNHDDRAGDPPASLSIRACDEPLFVEGLALAHHPRRRPGSLVLAGHLHPCVGLGGRANDFHRLPCFWFGGNRAVEGDSPAGVLDEGVLVLPAFGAFTGMHPIQARAGDRVYVVGGDRVLALPPPALPRGRRTISGVEP